MNNILIVVLLTILGTCLVVFLTWLGVMSCKFMKHKKIVELNLKDLNDNINYAGVELERKIYDAEQRCINAMHNEITIRESRCEGIDRKLDSRIDKLNEKVNVLASNVVKEQ